MSKNNVVDMRRYPSQIDFSPTQEIDRAKKTGLPFSAVEKEGDETLVTRDPLGQMPLHLAVKDGRAYVANSIKDLQLVEGVGYEDAQVIPHASTATIDKNGNVSTERYLDFHNHLPLDFDPNKLGDVEYSAEYVRRKFDEVVDEILAGKTEIACLLSGGVDSMIAAFLSSQRLPSSQSYTMGIASSNPDDLSLATEYSKAFGMKQNVIGVSREEIIDSLRESIWRSEIYHLYNVYCAVGMVLIGRHLTKLGIHHAMTGEGANEAFGDYHNWDVTLADGKTQRIQSTDISAFNSPEGRHAYVWGNPNAERKGFYNKQLGSGLAKHGVSRMYKPMHEYGTQLYSPFMQADILKVIASIPEDKLAEVGGKPGFMGLVFQKDIQNGRIPADFFTNKKKTRLQDANPDGQGGITETLLRAGFDQERVIQIFNELFRSNLANDTRFTDTRLK